MALTLSSLLLAAALLPSDDSAPPGSALKFLSALTPQFEAARYEPAEVDFAWVGWIGGHVNLAEKGPWAVFFAPDVETILGHRLRSFEAVQANYSLEVGVHRTLNRLRVSPFFHHVSRHVQDRDKRQAVDWNFLGARLDGPWPEKWKREGAFAVSFGMATLASAVEYNWELRGSADIDIVHKGARALFVLADVRHVGAAATPEFPRDHLTDVRLETGFRYWQPASQFALFAAYERRNDVLVEKGSVRTRALFGFRIRGRHAPTPATVPLP